MSADRSGLMSRRLARCGSPDAHVISDEPGNNSCFPEGRDTGCADVETETATGYLVRPASKARTVERKGTSDPGDDGWLM